MLKTSLSISWNIESDDLIRWTVQSMPLKSKCLDVSVYPQQQTSAHDSPELDWSNLNQECASCHVSKPALGSKMLNNNMRKNPARRDLWGYKSWACFFCSSFTRSEWQAPCNDGNLCCNPWWSTSLLKMTSWLIKKEDAGGLRGVTFRGWVPWGGPYQGG
jgi:hypothetical protein